MTTGIVALSVGLASLLAAPGWYPAASDVSAVADGGTIKGRIVGVIPTTLRPPRMARSGWRMFPPGAYLLVTWHEPTGVVETPVIVKAKEETRITVELKP